MCFHPLLAAVYFIFGCMEFKHPVYSWLYTKYYVINMIITVYWTFLSYDQWSLFEHYSTTVSTRWRDYSRSRTSAVGTAINHRKFRENSSSIGHACLSIHWNRHGRAHGGGLSWKLFFLPRFFSLVFNLINLVRPRYSYLTRRHLKLNYIITDSDTYYRVLCVSVRYLKMSILYFFIL